MSDLIDRQALLKQIDIDSDGEPGYYGDTWKFIDTIKSMPRTELSTNLAEVGTDCISRQAVKEILDKNQMPYHVYPYVWDAINALPLANTSEIPNSSDTISRAKAIDGKICIRRSNGVEIYDDYVVPVEYLEQLPYAQPEIVRCKDCKHHWTHRCMDSMPIERCDLGQTFYDAEVDYCSLAERREVTT